MPSDIDNLLDGSLVDRQAAPKKDVGLVLKALGKMHLVGISRLAIKARKPRQEGKNGIAILNPYGDIGIELSLQSPTSEYFLCILHIEGVRQYTKMAARLGRYIKEALEEQDTKKEPLPAFRKAIGPVRDAVKIAATQAQKELAALRKQVNDQVMLRNRLGQATQRLEQIQALIALTKSQVIPDEELASLRTRLEELSGKQVKK